MAHHDYPELDAGLDPAPGCLTALVLSLLLIAIVLTVLVCAGVIG